MTEKVENLILEQLRAIRADVAAVKEDTREIKQRLNTLERGQARSHADHGDLYGDYARQQSTIDRLTERLERIERRLELDTPQ